MNRQDFQAKAAKISMQCMTGNAVLTVFKLIAGIVAHSGAMISDAIHSASDIVSDIIVAVGLKISARDPDAEHPYGHERFECVASILLSVILALVGGGIGLSAIKQIAPGSARDYAAPGALALVAAIVSIVVKEGMFRYVRHFAVLYESPALNAEAWHHRSDALSSIGALAGIAGARLGVRVMEPIASLVICGFILKAALQIFKDAIDRMVDRSCDDAMESAIRECALSREGVLGVDLLQTRMFGSRIYVDLEISADGDLPLSNAHAIAENVHASIEAAFPQVKHIMVHVNPRMPEPDLS